MNFSICNYVSLVLGEVGAPMKGEVVEMKVGVGDKVIKGQNLAVLSAMKMEMVLQSPVNGVVRAIEVKRGQKVEVNFQTLKFF